MRPYKHMTDKEFITVKGMTNIEGLKNKQIESIAHRSAFTIDVIRKSLDFNDYRARIRSITKTSPKKEEVAAKWNGEPKAVDSIVPLLERIAEAMEKLEEHWRSKSEGISRL